ncbi:MAG: DUF4175 family protein [Armatimonadota bacterium]
MTQMALNARLDRARSYWRALLAAEGTLWTTAVLLAAFLVCFHLDRWLVFPMRVRLAVWAVLGVLFSGLFLFLILRPLLQRRSPEEIAVLVERKYPQLRERLLSAVEFRGLTPEQRQGMSAALLHDLEREAEQEAGGLNFQAAFARTGLMRSATGLGVVLLALLLHVVAAGPAFSAFLQRMALMNTPVWRDTRIQVSPLSAKLLRGTDFELNVSQEGKSVDRGRLHFRFNGGAWQSVALKSGMGQPFEHRFASLTERMEYYATAGDGITDQGEVVVVDPAAVIGAKLKLTFPEYMARPAETVSSDSGGVAAPVGTLVELELKANKPLEIAEATLPKAKPAPWSVKGDTVAGALTVKDNGHYALRLKDTDGFFAPEPQTFPIKAIRDQTPEVQLLDPAGDLDVVPNARIKLVITAKDDYGIATVRVPYRVGEGASRSMPAGQGGRREKQLELTSLWELGALNLKPGDLVRYRAEALDYDNLNGPHVGKTGEFQLRIIDEAEANRRYEEQRAEILAALRELQKEQKGSRAEVEAERRRGAPNADALASAEERQRSVGFTAADLARRVQDLRRMAETNNLAPQADVQSQQNAQQRLDQLSKNQVPQAANRIGSAQAQAQSNAQQARSELSQASGEQQQIQQELQKIEQLLRPGSELQRMAQRFERLAQQQRQLQAETRKMLPQTLGREMSELSAEQRAQLQENAQQQANLQRATAEALQDLQRAAEAMRSANGAQAEAARETAQDLQRSGVTEQQSQAAQNASRNSLGQANSQQQQAAEALEQAAEQLRSAADPNDPRNVQRQLRQASRRLQRLMTQQQEAQQQARQLMSPQQRAELAQRQREIEREARSLARQLQRLQRQTPSAGRAAQQLEQAGEQSQQASQSLSQGQNGQQQAQQQQQRAMQAMRRAMESLQQAQAEAQGQERQDPFAELRKSLEQLVARQKAIQQGTRQAEATRQLGELPAQQRDLEADTQKLEAELPSDVFKSFSRQARRQMERAKQGLEQGNAGANPTQQAQGRAASLLEQLKNALDPNPDDNDEQDGGGQQQGGQQQGGQQQQQDDKEIQRRLAEIRLLRFMEQGIRAQTQDVDDNRSGDELTPAQKDQIAEAARQQEEARKFADEVAEALKRNGQISSRIKAASGHMSEAKRGLDRSQSGEPVQEQESQAIIKLSEALKLTQQMARQQQQQRQQQQRQQQAGRQQGQQEQQAGQGQPSPGQAQQGNSPALRSLQRRTGLQGGPQAGYDPTNRGFAGLDPRSQDALRQGYKEKIPAEYQDLIQRYYSGLSKDGRK